MGHLVGDECNIEGVGGPTSEDQMFLIVRSLKKGLLALPMMVRIHVDGFSLAG